MFKTKYYNVKDSRPVEVTTVYTEDGKPIAGSPAPDNSQEISETEFLDLQAKWDNSGIIAMKESQAKAVEANAEQMKAKKHGEEVFKKFLSGSLSTEEVDAIFLALGFN